MFINLKSDTVFKINKVYSLNTKNRKFIDIIFNKLHKQRKLH